MALKLKQSKKGGLILYFNTKTLKLSVLSQEESPLNWYRFGRSFKISKKRNNRTVLITNDLLKKTFVFQNLKPIEGLLIKGMKFEPKRRPNYPKFSSYPDLIWHHSTREIKDFTLLTGITNIGYLEFSIFSLKNMKIIHKSKTKISEEFGTKEDGILTLICSKGRFVIAASRKSMKTASWKIYVFEFLHNKLMKKTEMYADGSKILDDFRFIGYTKKNDKFFFISLECKDNTNFDRADYSNGFRIFSYDIEKNTLNDFDFYNSKIRYLFRFEVVQEGEKVLFGGFDGAKKVTVFQLEFEI